MDNSKSDLNIYKKYSCLNFKTEDNSPLQLNTGVSEL